jgi:hypothetical protein
MKDSLFPKGNPETKASDGEKIKTLASLHSTYHDKKTATITFYIKKEYGCQYFQNHNNDCSVLILETFARLRFLPLSEV